MIFFFCFRFWLRVIAAPMSVWHINVDCSHIKMNNDSFFGVYVWLTCGGHGRSNQHVARKRTALIPLMFRGRRLLWTFGVISFAFMHFHSKCCGFFYSIFAWFSNNYCKLSQTSIVRADCAVHIPATLQWPIIIIDVVIFDRLLTNAGSTTSECALFVWTIHPYYRWSEKMIRLCEHKTTFSRRISFFPLIFFFSRMPLKAD